MDSMDSGKDHNHEEQTADFGALALLAALGHFYAKPLLAQVRAALIQNVDEPARNPFSLSDSNVGSEDFWKVPPGKRYVIEQYTAYCETSSTGQVTSAAISVTKGGNHNSATTPGFLSYNQSARWPASRDTPQCRHRQSPQDPRTNSVRPK